MDTYELKEYMTENEIKKAVRHFLDVFDEAVLQNAEHLNTLKKEGKTDEILKFLKIEEFINLD